MCIHRAGTRPSLDADGVGTGGYDQGFSPDYSFRGSTQSRRTALKRPAKQQRLELSCLAHREPALSEMFVAYLLARNIRYEGREFDLPDAQAPMQFNTSQDVRLKTNPYPAR
jgi:hypothetical protein